MAKNSLCPKKNRKSSSDVRRRIRAGGVAVVCRRRHGRRGPCPGARSGSDVGAGAERGNRPARRRRLRRAHQGRPRRPPGAGGAGRPGAARRRTRPPGRIYPLQEPGPVDRLQRPARRRRHDRGARFAQRSSARSGLRLLRASSQSRPGAPLPGGAAEGRRRVRAPVAGARAWRPSATTEGARRAAHRRHPRRRSLPQHRHRGARRFQARLRHPEVDRGRKARGPAAGRCGDRAGQDRRQAGAADAGGAAAGRRRGRCSRRWQRRSACSASTAPPTLATCRRCCASPTTIPAIRSWCGRRRPASAPSPSRATPRRSPCCSPTASRRATRSARRSRWRWQRWRCATRRC